MRDLEADLREAVAGEVRFDAATRAAYATDASNFRQPPIGVVIPALSLGLGVAFLLLGRRLVTTEGSPGLSIATFLSVAWLLISWWPHANFHRIANGWANLLLVDYFFHTTAIIAAVVIAAYFLAVVRERQEAGQTGTDTSNLASSSRA